MKFRIIVLALLTAIAIFPVFARDEALHHVQFDDFSFDYDAALAAEVNTTHLEASIETFPPEPAHSLITLLNTPADGGEMAPVVTVRVYRTADMPAFEGYGTTLEQLQTLLSEQPDLTQYNQAVEGKNSSLLPVLPVIAEGQTFRAAAQYIETDSVTGIRFVTAYQAAAEPLSANILFYTFQGLSKDGEYAISVMVWLENDVFPKADAMTGAEVEAFRANEAAYWKDASDKVNNAAADAFTPGLATLDELVKSFQIAG